MDKVFISGLSIQTTIGFPQPRVSESPHFVGEMHTNIKVQYHSAINEHYPEPFVGKPCKTLEQTC